MQTVRVFFTKKGDARFLSHLDPMRCFTRALKRSGMEIWYTQGFNSHIYLMFSSPLSLGFESEYETMDFRLLNDVTFDPEYITDSLNRSLPDGVKSYKASTPVHDHTEIAYSEWDIRITGTPDKLEETFKQFIDQEEITISRTNKKGQIKKENAVDYIKSISFEKRDEGIEISAVLKSDSSSSLNPGLLINTYIEYANIGDADVRICRKRLLLNNMNPFE